MRHIMQLISNDPYVQREAYQYLKNQWPQLNDTTKVAYTNNRVVYIADAPVLNLFDNMIRVAVSGWHRLRGIAMTPTLKRLDDPSERVAYTDRLWLAFFKSPTYLFWRITGKVFKRQDWYEKGTELTPNPILKMPEIKRREIELRHYGWHLQSPRYTSNEIADIYCGYDNVTDTLWVLNR